MFYLTIRTVEPPRVAVVSLSLIKGAALMIQVNRPMTLGALVVGALVLGAASASAQDQLGDMTKDPNQWVMAGRTYDLQRYSPLVQSPPPT
jgi:glucose dehydrogenase